MARFYGPKLAAALDAAGLKFTRGAKKFASMRLLFTPFIGGNFRFSP